MGRTIRVRAGSETMSVEVAVLDAHAVLAQVGGESFDVQVDGREGHASAAPSGVAVQAAPRPRAVRAAEPKALPRTVTAPLPGIVTSVDVREGDEVTRGQRLCVVEAMKMHNPILAARDGRVAQVTVGVGDHVVHGQLLLEFA